jgi:hypothetical protein
MRRLLLLPLAGLLVIAGATAAMAAPSAITDTMRQAQGMVNSAGALLSEVLEELVGDGVIEQSQADAITQAVDARIAERRAEMQAQRGLMRGLLEDGVITSEELEQLPTEHPWRNIEGLDELLEDGQLTLDELRSAGGQFGRGHGPRGGGWGPGGPGPGGHGGWGDAPGRWCTDESQPDNEAQSDS